MKVLSCMHTHIRSPGQEEQVWQIWSFWSCEVRQQFRFYLVLRNILSLHTRKGTTTTLIFLGLVVFFLGKRAVSH